jgi:putative hemolysin
LTEAEIKAMVDVSGREGVLPEDEKEMLTNVLEFDERRAKDIMTPRTGMSAVDITSGYRGVMRVFREEGFSRLPVYRGDIDHIVGVLHLKDVAFLNDKGRQFFRPERYMRKPFFSYENKPINALLNDMRAKSVTTAVILDEYGGTSGLVTIEDMIEEIVGDINDEHDDANSDIQHIAHDEYYVEGTTRIDGFNELTGGELTSDIYESIGGYALGLFGKIPEAGDTAEGGGFRFTVVSAAANRIEKMKVKKVGYNES